MALRSAPDGDHVLVVRVTPEHLGEVTVHATVSKGDLSVQLFASTAGGHDALRSMLGDLQRDLGSGAAGTTTDLSLGTGTAPQQDQRGQQPAWVGTGAGGGDGRPSRDERTGRTAARGAPVADPSADLRIPTAGSALLDVLA
ncbi:flagellar hook-length control protein FliK [Amnibacterium kyonggiense]